MKDNMLKVVYFDEGSAIDYVDIFNGGQKSTISSKGKEKKIHAESTVESSIKTGILFKALEPFFNLSAGGKLGAGLSALGEAAFKTTISNTVLSDFIQIAEDDSNISIAKNYKLSAFQESITFMKMYSPYFNMMNLQSASEKQEASINFQKVDETLEKGKGYYELIGANEEERIIFRFNFKAFRNNYSLVDLTKMNLTFYSVKVGMMEIENLNVNKEFDFNKNEPTLEEILSDSKGDSSQLVNVYDVILAGIKL